MKKKLNSKSKGEQLFIMAFLFVVFLSIFCLTGCQQPVMGSDTTEGVTSAACSIPGCGGILCSGKGCNTPFWANTCNFMTLKNDSTAVKYGLEHDISMMACDIEYFGTGCGGCLNCFGCGATKKDCYIGCMNIDGSTGLYYGKSDSSERVIGYNSETENCSGCTKTGDQFYNFIELIKSRVGVD